MRVSLFLVGVAEMDDGYGTSHFSYADLPAELGETLEAATDRDDGDYTIFKVDYVKEVTVDYPDPEDDDQGSPEHDRWRERAIEEALKVMVGTTSTIADLINDRT